MTATISGRQVTKLHTVLSQLGITDRAEKLRLVTAAIYRPVESTKDLTWTEANVAISTLQSIAGVRDDRAGAIERLLSVAERRMAAS